VHQVGNYCIEYNMLVAWACKISMTAHAQSSCHSHLVQYSTKTYAAVALELHVIFKFCVWLTMSSQLHAAAVEHLATQSGFHYTR